MPFANEITQVYERDGLIIQEFKPSFKKLFFIEMEPLTVLKRLRFGIDLLYGYSVFYLYIEGNVVGYCTITSGKNSRYTFATDKDIMIGPYFVKDEYRGRGYAKKLVNLVISECKLDWERGFLYIKNENLPSIKVADSIGAKFLFHAHNTRLRKLVKKENGEFGIYMLLNPKANNRNESGF